MRAAVREAADDLDALVAAARAAVVRVSDRERRAAELTGTLLANLPWDRVMLASVLGVALVRLADVAEERAASATGGEAAREAPPNGSDLGGGS